MKFFRLLVFSLVLFSSTARSSDLLKKFQERRSAQLTEWALKEEADHSLFYEGKLSTIKTASFPSMELSFHYYQSKVPGPRPLLLFFPAVIGFIPFENTLGRALAYLGISSLIPVGEEELINPNIPLKDLDHFLATLTMRALFLADWAVKRSEVDPEKLGIFGVSQGGIRGALMMEVDKRFKGAVLVVAGGNLPEILTYGEQEKLEIFRKARMAEENMGSTETLLKRLQDSITLDPLKLAHLRHSEDFFLLISLLDKTVPTKNQWELWEALGRPHYYSLPVGHIPTSALSPVFFKKYHQFFKERWGWDQNISEKVWNKAMATLNLINLNLK